MSEKNEINRGSKIALVMSAIAIFGIIVLMLGSYYFYEERYTVLSDQYIALRAQMASMVRAKQSAPMPITKEMFQNVEKELAEFRAELAKSNNNRPKNLSEVNYLVLIANEKLQFSHDIPGAIATLKMAQQRLSMILDPGFSDLKVALNKDLTALSETPAFDQQALWENVGALSLPIEKLRLKELGIEVEAVPAKPLTLSSWQNALYSAWDEFKSLIRITRIEQNPIPLTGLVQEQAQLKRELQWLIAQAQWAVLQKNQKIYTESLKNIENLVKRYFVENAEETDLLERLNALQAKNVAVSVPSLAETLQALSQTSLDVKE